MIITTARILVKLPLHAHDTRAKQHVLVPVTSDSVWVCVCVCKGKGKGQVDMYELKHVALASDL
jgi:hypothetical protein